MARLRREVDEACLMRRGIHCTEEIDTLSESQKTPTALGKPSRPRAEASLSTPVKKLNPSRPSWLSGEKKSHQRKGIVRHCHLLQLC
jgi:hypothetical protein